jgi:1-deoxy-D-xylulose-5-phosphate synthase
MAEAFHQTGSSQRAVAVIGDGAMTAGMAFEALNNAGASDLPLLVVLNDNDMSISPNVGALNNYLAKLMSGRFLCRRPPCRREGLRSAMPPIKELAKRAEEHMKGMVTPGTLFEEFGFNYIGPIDGHDLGVLLETLDNIRQLPARSSCMS